MKALIVRTPVHYRTGSAWATIVRLISAVCRLFQRKKATASRKSRRRSRAFLEMP